METDRVGDAGGKGGNLKENRPSRDPHGLNSDKRAERQDQLHISIQEKNTSMKDIMHDGSAQLNRLGPTRIPIHLIPFIFTSPYSPFLYFRMPILSFPL
jgi:hypothetical protein